MSYAFENIIVEVSAEGYAVVTLNRPDAMNALSPALSQEFAQALEQLEADPTVRALVLTGAGKAFCAGLDLKALAANGAVKGFLGKRDPVRALAGFTGPIIGAINGAAVTGGFELALACDVLVLSEHARFADTHARVGIIPGWGLSQKLSRMVGIARAKEISLTGNFVSAEQAVGMGLANRVVPADQLLPQAIGLARDMLSVVPAMLPAMKRLIDEGFALPFGEAMLLETQRSAQWAAGMRPGDVAERRAAVMQRGREQAGQG
jgi:enoyl-CoA hydratase